METEPSQTDQEKPPTETEPSAAPETPKDVPTPMEADQSGVDTAVAMETGEPAVSNGDEAAKVVASAEKGKSGQ